ncbi:MAG: Gfo/Idh/MocA family oxidoreductase [Nitratireductor rhodophyticola]|uniref:Gfo/Idh/MocA family protein n=1 Tax=Nitratireductor rhodophyticola TaxID=2854036 RepID=UPI0032D95831
MRIGLVGYGTGGRHFHAPFIAATEGITLAGVVARSPERVAAVKVDLPEVPVFSSLTDMLRSGQVDAVTITTPPGTRRALVLEAIEAGVHVVADKPFAPNSEGARELEAAADAKGVVLSVYHNRRCDADFRTLKKVIDSRVLGSIWRIHSRLEFDDPETLEAGPSGGLLRDLGSHLVDQMVFLLGPVATVDAQLDYIDLPEGSTDASFSLMLRHTSGVTSYLTASKVNRLKTREFLAYGSGGSYTSSGTDVQAQAIFAGKRPADDLQGWGIEAPQYWGTLNTAAGSERVPSEQGRYHDHYAAFLRAVKEGGEPPVTPAEAAHVLAVLDAARLSAANGHSINVDGRAR